MKIFQKKKDIVCDLSINENFISQLNLDKSLKIKIEDIEFNRYPSDELYHEIEKQAARLYKEEASKVLLCNGSDDGIFLLLQYINLQDKNRPVLLLNPTFSMYPHYAKVLGLRVVESKLKDDFYPNMEEIARIVQDQHPSIIFLPNPLAPTGKILQHKDILHIAEIAPKTIIAVDEAYIEFSMSESITGYTEKYKNIVVLRTLSKFYGMAALRIGFIISHHRDEIRKIQAPFSVSVVNAVLASHGLASVLQKKPHKLKDQIIASREELWDALRKARFVDNISPSDSNFIYIETKFYEAFFLFLKKNGFKVKNLHPVCPHAIRIGIPSSRQVKTLTQLIFQFDQDIDRHYV